MSDAPPRLPDLPIVDAHHHLCNLSRQSYPWLERAVEQGFPYHGDDTPIRRDYLVADYLADVGDLHLAGSVHVENGAADPRLETEWLTAVMRSSPVPSALVAKVDLLADTASADLEWQAAQPGVRGIRQILCWHPDRVYTHTSRSDIITDPLWRANFGRLPALGLSFDLQIYPHQLEQALDLARAFPDVPIILDHAGMPIGRAAPELAEWQERMRRLARCPNVTCKISGIGTQDHHWTVESIRPIVLGTIEAFGPSRCMFASNFPVDSLYSSLAELYAAFNETTYDFTAGERARLFSGTATETYRLSPGSTSEHRVPAC